MRKLLWQIKNVHTVRYVIKQKNKEVSKRDTSGFYFMWYFYHNKNLCNVNLEKCIGKNILDWMDEYEEEEYEIQKVISTGIHYRNGIHEFYCMW